MKTTSKLWIGIAALIILSPLGLILPQYFKAGGAWGEWGRADLKNLVGYVPKGLEKLANLWRAPIPGYSRSGDEAKAACCLNNLSYVLSAIIGVAVIVLIMFFIGKKLTKKDGAE